MRYSTAAHNCRVVYGTCSGCTLYRKLLPAVYTTNYIALGMSDQFVHKVMSEQQVIRSDILSDQRLKLNASTVECIVHHLTSASVFARSTDIHCKS